MKPLIHNKLEESGAQEVYLQKTKKGCFDIRYIRISVSKEVL
jgi:hypothetical protein